MKHNALFLQWLLLVSTIFALTVFGILGGAPAWIQRSDPTGISFTICVVGYITTARFGSRFRSVQNALARKDTRAIKELVDFLPTAAYWSGLCRDLGFLGTIVGFVLLLPVFLHLSEADPKAIVAIIQSMGVNLGTAFVTTMTGLVASMIIDFQGRRLAHALREVSHD